MQVIVIDKENGGKADALNAGINASTTPYFVSLDADSILDQRALKELMRVIQEDPRVVAVGGQVAIANGCTVRNSHVVKVGLPARSLPRFQMVEYLRSFTAARTGLDRMHAILILSGVFAVFEKDTVIRAGGYLTPTCGTVWSRSMWEPVSAPCAKTWRSSCGCTATSWTSCTTGALLSSPPGGLDRGPRKLRIAPQTAGALVSRTPRVLAVSPRHAWQSKFGRIGWFALPAFWLFEYYGPLVEIVGYACILFLFVMQWMTGLQLFGNEYLLAFLLASLGYGILVNVLSVLVGAWRFRYGLADRLQRHLLPFSRRGEVLILLLYAVLENLGYRQLTLYWRLRGLWDAWRGKTGWEKFGRVGFRPGEAAAHG